MFDVFAAKLSNLSANRTVNSSSNANDDNNDYADADTDTDADDFDDEWKLWKNILSYKNSDKIVENFRPSKPPAA